MGWPMNGMSDVGGMSGFGPVRWREGGASFHADWEKTVFAIAFALQAQGIYSVDESRRSVEAMHPAEYLASSYFERWLSAAERLLIEKGVLTEADLAQRLALAQSGELPGEPAGAAPRLAGLVAEVIRDGRSKRRAADPPRFRVGDGVVARNMHPRHHSRLPRYARGRRGRVERVYGGFIFPDSHAHGLGEQPQQLYCVRFDGREIWGDDAEPGTSLSLDLFESYLLPLPEGACRP